MSDVSEMKIFEFMSKVVSFKTSRMAQQLHRGPGWLFSTTQSAYAKLSDLRHRNSCSAGSASEEVLSKLASFLGNEMEVLYFPSPNPGGPSQ